MDILTIASIKHDTTVINQITSQGFTPNVSEILLAGSGFVDAGLIAVGEARPQLTFTTQQIKTALAGLGGINGIAISGSNFAFWYQKTAEGGIRATGLNHIKATVVSGMIIPVTLNIPFPGPATLSYLVVMISADGDASPIAFVTAQALDAGQVIGSEGYVMGGISLNGADLPGVTEATIDFGISQWISGGSGKPFPTNVAMANRRPTIVLRSHDASTAVGWGVTGVAQGETDSVITLSEVVEGAVHASDNITFTVDAGAMRATSIDGQHGERMGAGIKLVPTHDGVADVIAIGGLT